MPKLRVFSSHELIKLLIKHGFIEDRTKGSHKILQKKYNSQTITIPIPMHKEIKIGTLTSIIRQSKLPKNLFETTEK